MPSLRLNPAQSLQDLWGCHHHHMGDAVVDHGDGCLCGDIVGALVISPAFQTATATLSELPVLTLVTRFLQLGFF